MNCVFRITNPNKQVIEVISHKGDYTATTTIRLNGLELATA